jgi:hypothetical protein
MKKRFGWNNISYTKQNVTKKRPPVDQLPANTLKSIKKNHELDIDLYQFAKQLLIEQVKNLDPISKKELHAFLEKK